MANGKPGYDKRFKKNHSVVIDHLEMTLHLIEGDIKPTRESSLAKTKIEEAIMWIERDFLKNGLTLEDSQ